MSRFAGRFFVGEPVAGNSSGLDDDCPGAWYAYLSTCMPDTAFIVLMTVYDICCLGFIIFWLRVFFLDIQEGHRPSPVPHPRRRLRDIWCPLFAAIVLAGILSFPGLAFIDDKEHPKRFMMAVVTLCCTAVPLLCFLVAVILHLLQTQSKRRKVVPDEAPAADVNV